MGALSALVVGACMTAPLFAVLAFIAHTGDALLGGAALFSMGLGLGVPLLILGFGAGTLLPRAGAWMDGVKVFFGVVLLAAALWIVWPVLGATATMLLSALWLLVASASLGLFSAPTAEASVWRRLGRGIGAAFAIWAAVLLVGLAAGSSDPLRPLAVLAARGGETGVANASNRPDNAPQSDLTFAPVRSSNELDQSRQNGCTARHARFLRGLVRQLQGDGEIHLQRPACSGEIKADEPAARRCDREQHRRSNAAQALQPVRAAGDHLFRSAWQGSAARRWIRIGG